MQMVVKWDLLWVAGGEELWGKSRDCPCVLLDCSCHITGQTSFPWLKKHWTPLFGCMTLRMASLHLWFNLDKSFFYTHLTYLEYIHSFARLSARAGFTFLGKTENHAVMPLLSQCCSPSTRTPQQRSWLKLPPNCVGQTNPTQTPSPAVGQLNVQYSSWATFFHPSSVLSVHFCETSWLSSLPSLLSAPAELWISKFSPCMPRTRLCSSRVAHPCFHFPCASSFWVWAPRSAGLASFCACLTF